MDKTVVSVTSNTSVGCTFVDWSIQFLSGQTQHYHADSNSWIDLTHNPVNNSTAHNYQKNHPAGFDQTSDLLSQIDQQGNGVFTLYPASVTYAKLHNSKQLEGHDQIIDYIKHDYHKVFELCSQKTKLIFVDSSPEVALYHITLRRRSFSLLQENQFGPSEIIQQEADEYFFKDSLSYFDSDYVWDKREKRALCIRPYTLGIPNLDLDFSLPHLWIDSRSLWTLGDLVLKDIMNYVGLAVDPVRFDLWLLIYQIWARKQLEILNFCHVLPHIIDSIVNNWNYQIGELSFEQEVAIQHFLIYKHNLNLKTWQLEKFPSNTKDLHKLLEPNTHLVPTIY
jgi:hypothetical protein